MLNVDVENAREVNDLKFWWLESSRSFTFIIKVLWFGEKFPGENWIYQLFANPIQSKNLSKLSRWNFVINPFQSIDLKTTIPSISTKICINFCRWWHRFSSIYFNLCVLITKEVIVDDISSYLSTQNCQMFFRL